MTVWTIIVVLTMILALLVRSESRLRSDQRRVLAERMNLLWAETCPVCGRSRIFYKEGPSGRTRMLAPPHRH